MITIWGRANSINVQKVLWALAEIDEPYERIDAGMQFGVNNTPEFLLMNPNGLVPVLKEGDFVLWESHAILRYLARRDKTRCLLPASDQQIAHADQWLEWYSSTLWESMKPVFRGLVRTPPEQRNMAAINEGIAALAKNMTMLNKHLSKNAFVAGDSFSIGDIPLALVAHRWYLLDIERPTVPALDQWFKRVSARPAFQKDCAGPLS